MTRSGNASVGPDASTETAPASPGNAVVLARDPFVGRTPLPFRDAHCTRLLAQLNHLIDKTELLAMVSGPPGSGKSVLARMFVEQAPKHFVVLSMDASAGLRSVDLLSEVAERFGNRRRKSDDIHDLFTAHYSRGKQPVLVIDSAEHLEPRALQLVGKLTEHGLHLVLFVRADHEGAIGERLDGERIQVLRVAAFDERRTYCYLQHCLATAGYQGPMPFDRKALAEIASRGDGTPAAINRLAHDYLLEEPRPPVSSPASTNLERGASPRVIAVGLLLALVFGVVVVLMLTGRLGGRETSDARAPAASGLVSDTESGPSAASPREDVGVSSRAPVIDSVEPPSVGSVAAVPPDTGLVEPPRPEGAASPEPIVEAGDDLLEVPESIETLELDQVSADLDPADAALDVSDAIAATGSTPEPASSSRRVNVPESAVVADNVPEEEGAEIAPEVSGPLLPDNAAVRARNPKHFTMQLVAGPTLSAVQRFADRYAVKAESVIYEITKDGKAHYALIYQDYATREAALAALEALPDALKAREPWLRRLSAIQRSLGDE